MGKFKYINASLTGIMIILLQCMPHMAAAVVPGWLQQLRTLGADPVGYDYVLQLVNSKGVVADSIKGHLYRNGKQYLDSNTTGLSMSDGSWFCKFDTDNKTAVVYNVQAVSRRMHISVAEGQSVIAAFPDSIIAKYGTLKTDSSASHYIIRLDIVTSQYATAVTVFLSKKDRHLEKVIMETPEPAAPGETEIWRKKYVLYNIDHEVVPGIFDMRRFYTISGNSVVLPSKYTNYKLTSLIN